MNQQSLPAAEYLELKVDLVYSQTDVACVRALVEAAVIAPADRQALHARLAAQELVCARIAMLKVLGLSA